MATETTAPGLTLGPQDPDAGAGLTERLGVHNHATQLLKRHRANFPVQLTVALGRPIDEARSEALDHDEVLSALKALKGRRAFFKESTDVLEDAVVRGTSDRDRVVSVVFRRGGEMGRSAQGVLPYASMSASIRAYEQAEANKNAGGGGAGLTVAPTDDAVAAANARAAQAEAAAKAAEEQRRAESEQLASLLERLERLEDPEPFDGYDEMTAADKVEQIRGGGIEEYGRAGLERMATYEETHKKHATVLSAIEDILAGTPAGGGE